MKIVKHSGNIVEYNPIKLRQSLLKSGTSPMTVSAILKTIEKEIYEGISTKQIYKMAFALLKKECHSHARPLQFEGSRPNVRPAGFFFKNTLPVFSLPKNTKP